MKKLLLAGLMVFGLSAAAFAQGAPPAPAPTVTIRGVVVSLDGNALPGPNGTLRAIEVHYFAPGFNGRAFSSPYDLGPASSMTNGNVENIATTKVDKVDAHTLTIKI